MLQVNFSPFPQINTPRLVLREISNADVNEIFFLRSDATVLTYLDKDPEKSVEETAAWIRRIKNDQENNEGILWGISTISDITVIGTICYWRLDKRNYRAEIGYALHPAAQGKGIMDEAMKAVLEYGFTQMKLHSVEANVNPLNQGSIKLLERNGFVKEAHFRENFYYNGKFLDSFIYSLITPLS